MAAPDSTGENLHQGLAQAGPPAAQYQSTAGATRLAPQRRAPGTQPRPEPLPRREARRWPVWLPSSSQQPAPTGTPSLPSNLLRQQRSRVAGAQAQHRNETQSTESSGLLHLSVPSLQGTTRHHLEPPAGTGVFGRSGWPVPGPGSCRSRGGSEGCQLLHRCCSAATSLRTTAQPCPTTREGAKQSRVSRALEKAGQ